MIARYPLAILAAALALSACGGGAPAPGDAIDALDAELAEAATGNAADPIVSVALADPIMSDPALTSRANADAIRPPSQPYAAPIPSPDVVAAPAPDLTGLKPAPPPTDGGCSDCTVARDALTLAALAAAQRDAGTRRCAGQLRYAAGWANRLGDRIPLFNNARVVEAAGVQNAGCGLRVVSFNAAQPVKTMLDFYFTRATAAGFSAEHRSDDARHVLSGVRTGGEAYAVYLTARADGGTDVDLVSTAGA